MSMQWKILVLILRARANMRVMRQKARESRDKMKHYCCIFPGEFEFERNTLVQLWMAMGFSSQRHEEEFYERYFDDLLKEQFIFFSRYDIVRGITMYKIDPDEITVTKSTNCYTWLEDGKFWHLSLVSRDINHKTFEELKSFGAELRTLLFIPNYGSFVKTIPPDMFLTLDFLHALDLSGSHIIELPRSIGNARQLRYLDLSFTLIENLPEAIGRLTQLQTLKLLGCKYIFELPRGIKELKCLRHLDFDVLGQLTSLPKGIGALTELRTLSAFIIVDSEEGCSIRELKAMNNLSGSFCISGLENVSYVDINEAGLQYKKHLSHIQLRWNDLRLSNKEDLKNACEVVANLILSTSLEELRIICYPSLEFPSWINLRNHAKLISITLFHCKSRYLNLALGLLPNLKYLSIIHMNEVSKIDSLFRGNYDVHAAFPKLEKLEIDCMFGLKTWTDVFDNDFQFLSKLIIKQCPKLIGLPFLPHLCSLKYLEISNCAKFECFPNGTLSTSLENLTINHCPYLENSCLKNCKDWYKIQHVPNIWINLEDIHSSYEDSFFRRSFDEDSDEDYNAAIGSCSFTTTDGDDSSSTITDPVSIISSNVVSKINITQREKGRLSIISSNVVSKINITQWEKGPLLGSGSFGSVYEGISCDGFIFAVKEISLLDQGSRDRLSIPILQQEIELLSQFEHENIVRYLGSEPGDAKLYMFLELVTPGSLAKLYRQYILRDLHVSSYTRQILLGLKYLHDNNVVHMNLKCANILVASNGTVKLADFGLAEATMLKYLKSYGGTSFWMAPEVVNNKNEVGYGWAADIWSLGCTVLEMLTCNVPYFPMESVQALYRIGKGEPPPIPEYLSRDARRFLQKCFRVNPYERPTAAELLKYPFVQKKPQKAQSHQ